MKEKSFVSVVFYVRNFEEYIENFIIKLIPTIDDKFENYEFVCVNNDSRDESINILKRIHNERYLNVSLNIITLSYCRSIEEAMSAGIDLAIGDFVFTFDSILIDYSLETIYQSYLKALEGNDLVFVSPDKKVTVMQNIYYALYNFGLKKDMHISPERFKLFSRRGINRIGSMYKYFSNNSLTLISCGLDYYRIFYTPSKQHIKYDKEERSERIYKAIESLLVHTNSIQYLLMLLFSICFLISIILFVIKNYILACSTSIITVFFLLTLLVVQYIHILLNMMFNNKVHLIKNIEKVVK